MVLGAAGCGGALAAGAVQGDADVLGAAGVSGGGGGGGRILGSIKVMDVQLTVYLAMLSTAIQAMIALIGFAVAIHALVALKPSHPVPSRKRLWPVVFWGGLTAFLALGGLAFAEPLVRMGAGGPYSWAVSAGSAWTLLRALFFAAEVVGVEDGMGTGE